MKSQCFLTCLLVIATAALTLAQTDWPTYGHDAGSTRYSPLRQITLSNVNQLTKAWTYHMNAPAPAAPAGTPGQGEVAAGGGRGAAGARGSSGGRGGGGGGRGRSSEATPIIVNGIMYLPTPYNRIVALQPETGKELWSYDLKTTAASTRGVEYWAGDGLSPASIFFGTTDGRLVALNAVTGKPIPGFGTEGFVDMKQGIDNGFTTGQYSLSSPPVVYKNVLITGARVQESPSLGYAGDTRGWDAHTGKLLWQFHSVAQPGETGANTWQGDDWKSRSGTNVWGLISIDPQLGLVYLPYGSPTYDFYGGDRMNETLSDGSGFLCGLEADKCIGEDNRTRGGRILKCIGLCHGSAVRVSEHGDPAKIQGGAQTLEVVDVAGEAVFGRLRSFVTLSAAEGIEVNDAVVSGERGEIRVKILVRGTRPARDQHERRTLTFAFIPKPCAVHCDVTALRMSGGRGLRLRG